MESGQPEASTVASRPHLQVMSIDLTPKARILPSVSAGRLYESRRAHYSRARQLTPGR
jgi:hypothetical protein